MRSLTTFLTAAGFLSAISMVWGQWWVQLWVEPITTGEVPKLPVMLGLAWTYISVFFSMLAFGLAGRIGMNDQNREVGVTPLILLTAAFIMTFLNVGQSVLSSIMRLLLQMSLGDWLLKLSTSSIFWTLIMFAFVIIIVLVSYLLIHWRRIMFNLRIRRQGGES